MWTHRLMLESGLHSSTSFVTLTYNQESLPISASGPTLVPEDLSRFLKRYRKRIAPVAIRYFAIGEYGDATWRPHYHIAVFGHRSCDRGFTRSVPGGSEPDWRRCCDTCATVGQAWGLGQVHVGRFSREAAQYIAGYVVKKLTRNMDALYGERHPEFTRMSLKPGIGHGAMDEVADVLLQYGLEHRGPAPTALRVGAKLYPLGRYLRKALSLRLGHDEENSVEVPEVQEVREDAFNRSVSFASALVEKSEGKRASIAARNAIFKSGRSL